MLEVLPTYAPNVISANSSLVNAEAAAALPPTSNGFSMSGAPVLYDSADITSFVSQWANRIGSTQTTNSLNISVDGSIFIPISLATINLSTDLGAGTEIADLETAIAGAINDALANAGLTGRSVSVELQPAGEVPAAGANATLDDGITPADAVSVLKITSDNGSNEGSVFIQPANTNDLAVSLRLGSSQGGLEVSPFALHRPAPTDISLQAGDPTILRQLSDLTHDDITEILLPALDSTGASITAAVPVNLLADGGAVGTDPLWRNSEGGLTEILSRIADAINTYRNANPLTFFWTASVHGHRLSLTNGRGSANTIGTISSSPQDISGFFTTNVRFYSVGSGALAGLQTPTPAVDQDGNPAGVVTDGNPPLLSDYTNAFVEAERQIDLFNLLILPEDKGESPAPVPLSQVYGPASVFCLEQRAFLIMDPPSNWQSAQDAASNVPAVRIGIVKDHSAIYFPRLVLPDGLKTKTIGPAGAVAGVMARIDSTRGVWKAPAGVEADIRGIIGVEHRFNDREHGIMNPRAINGIRIFPTGIVIFGARTNHGDDDDASEYKYIPIRRLALFIEESLYRGLKWVVFEPNDEPLWAQIRLNVGAFMHDLYRRGAFQGQKPGDAYFVKCDSETTTQSDRNLGMVNIMVGFAPLKPTEFVILYLQQMAGQVQV